MVGANVLETRCMRCTARYIPLATSSASFLVATLARPPLPRFSGTFSSSFAFVALLYVWVCRE